ncbi:hypothetical protein HPB50_006527 [Hyalomma asiaticum]|uniref:Uncharacterized protein n=1 Tax=Hyalomma asiaticum TaxID=266040 RepID=A0ACB7RYC8_HYAAI|nr:hypothetical protein HPB50_006527 [Hyalomma asiaticum]
MSEFQDLFMLSDVAVQNQEPIANAETVFGLSDSANFGSSMRNSQDAAATAWAGIRPDTACTTPRNPSPRDTNETRRPQDVSALAADVAESTGNSVPSNEVLLQNALLVMQSLAGALQYSAQAAPQSARPRVKLDMPSYSGYHDSKSANEYLDRLLHYQQATGLTDAELLARVVPVSLTEQAARWFRLAGHRARTVEEFRVSFRDEFQPANYEWRLRRELELRTQHPDESLLEYVRAMDELYRVANPLASNAEKVECVPRQAHPTFAAHFRGCNYADLEELAAAAKRIQGDILAARAYRPPPSAAMSVEPRWAWNGGATAAQARRANASATFADEQVPRGWELSDRALDLYAYALRTAHDSPIRDAPRQEREGDTRPDVRHATERRSYDPPVRAEQRPGRRGFSGRCYQCVAAGHIARECRRTPGQEQTRGSGNGRGRR